MGSDTQYHYFCREEGPHVLSFKVPVSELKMKNTFPLGSGKSRLALDKDLAPVTQSHP
ncbi:MAG TPA: hypothetical protein VG733_03985 [Chthoniobacteraceae bacterium]|nr:hypothetical protein [Chthoniobacteraceae bacterium]